MFELLPPQVFDIQYIDLLEKAALATWYAVVEHRDAAVKVSRARVPAATLEEADERKQRMLRVVSYCLPDEAAIIADIQAHLRALVKPGVLDIDNPTLQGACMYSMAPDGDIALGRIPIAPEATQFRTNASILCMASGRGFKYTPLFGRILVDLAVTGSTPYQVDLGDFSTTRAHVFQRVNDR